MASETNPHVVQDPDMSMWDDPSFSNMYDNFGASGESPFDTSRLFEMSGAGAADSPNFAVKSIYDDEAARNAQPQQAQSFHNRSLVSSRSAESSSQDSASETSVRKRKNTASGTSESPPASNLAGLKMDPDSVNIKPEHTIMDTNHMASLQSFGRSMHNLSLDRDFAAHGNAMAANFDFESAASSPGGAMDLSDATYPPQMHMKGPGAGVGRAGHDPPMGTVEPSQFFFNSSTASPVSVKAAQTHEASPGAIFSNPTPSSDGADMFGNNNQMWSSHSAQQNPAWSNDYSTSFASPGGALGLTPSPVMNNATKALDTKPLPDGDRIPLHVAPIPAKSRVETQINIRLTLDWLPPRVKTLHLPTHTIAKAKLLAKDVVMTDDTLELQTMLVCTSAMNQPNLRERALQRAAAIDNSEIQARGAAAAGKKEDEEEDEADKPANGGEVKICTNCINRERKRAARKKLKKEEEQAHWEKYETERVIVFNTNEYKPWQEWQQSPTPKDNNMQVSDYYRPSDSAMQVVAPMRIACYCRHQNEKDGFQVIFTIKDHQGNVVAQEISDSILITDDHKTHPLAAMPGQVWYDGQFPAPGAFSSQSMVDLHSHMPSMAMSKSTGNLQTLGYGTQAFPNNMHSMSHFPSQPTSAAMTPRNLSRPASPTGSGPVGPNKKRKSSSAHRRIPSTLAMTRVDTGQNMASAPMSASGPFSPTSAGFIGSGDPSYITMPHSASRAQFHTGPSTPIENTPFAFGNLNRTNSMDSAQYQAFYSAPSSAHQSRAPSPVLHGPNLAAFQRQQAHGGANALPTRPNPFNMSGSSMNSVVTDPERPAPSINKVTPAEGPISGGTEVSIYGSGFAPGMEVMFGEQIATATTFWGEKALCCVLPPSQATGPVSVTIAASQMRQYPSPSAGQAQIFKYTGNNNEMHMMEMALRFISQKETGRPDQWQSLAKGAAQAWINQGPSAIGHTGFQGQQGNNFGDQGQDLRFA
ncbi:hypothetical protein MBLNU459_g8347t1 [Dothideomycetes sp. NU459]